MLRPDLSSDLLLIIDTVLERDDCSFGPDQRREQRPRLIAVIRFHTEEHHVTGADLRRIVTRRDLDGEVVDNAANT